MESFSHLSSETNPSSLRVSTFTPSCSTPPRSNPLSDPILINPSFSQLFRRPKLLTSVELKRRFSPIQSSSTKKRRHHLIRKHDCVVPFERNLPMPLILQKLFDQPEEVSSISANDSSCSMVPNPSSVPPSKQNHHQPEVFSISETMLKQKLKSLLAKN